jgi:hypothetical protein
MFLPPQPERFLSGPLHLYILNRDVGPDCNGNEISYYVDVIEGLAPDLNGNPIPDTCLGG